MLTPPSNVPIVLHRTYVHSALAFAGAMLVPPGPSRVLTITAGGDPIVVDELVSPSLWLGVQSRPGARLVFYGGVLTGSTPPPSVVEIQSRDPLGWRYIGAATVTSTGRFRYPYRSAPGTIGSRWPFRAVTLQTSVWQAGASRPHVAVVR
ncbi:MAG: hypothetical protein ABSG43_21320 [Solirubrobacteraceae bacterium]|jgi:hypothetical protein